MIYVFLQLTERPCRPLNRTARQVAGLFLTRPVVSSATKSRDGVKFVFLRQDKKM